MSSVKEALLNAGSQLQSNGIASAALDAAVLLAHVLQTSREKLLLNQDSILNNIDISEFQALIARRCNHEPIAYIIGTKEFWSLDFYVTRDTLIPRPDSETLIEAALKRVKDRAKPITLLDIGTGTGCLLIALLNELPQARGVGIDQSENALQVAKENARRHGVYERADFKQSHWCDALQGTFDLIISNPPYIATEEMAALAPDVAQYEPHSALHAGPDGLDAYYMLAPQVQKFLSPGGLLLLEVGHSQAEAVMMLLTKQGFIVERPQQDLSGVARCVIARRHH